MKRRDFIAAIGGAAAAWPLASRAQQSAMPMVGFLRSTPLADATHIVTAFRQGLKEAGFVEGQNVAVEYHSAESRPERLQALVADLIRRQVAVIVGNPPSVRMARAATTTVPIVFAGGSDPVAFGFVDSLNRPGGNVTGVVFFTTQLGSKRLEMLRQIVPKATIIGVLVHPNSPETEAERTDVQTAARAIGQQLLIIDANSERDIETAFATFAQRGVDALLCGSGPFFNSNREQIVALAARHALPANYSLREYATAGGLTSYGTSITDAYRLAGVYTGRILKGEKPGDLPVMQPTKFELVINLKTAKALGLSIPDRVLALADEVIE